MEENPYKSPESAFEPSDGSNHANTQRSQPKSRRFIFVAGAVVFGFIAVGGGLGEIASGTFNVDALLGFLIFGIGSVFCAYQANRIK